MFVEKWLKLNGIGCLICYNKNTVELVVVDLHLPFLGSNLFGFMVRAILRAGALSVQISTISCSNSKHPAAQLRCLQPLLSEVLLQLLCLGYHDFSFL